MSTRNEEKGQIVVLLAVALMALLVVSALAIDGGMIYSDRRFAQNAADSSSLSSAGWLGNYLMDHNIDYLNFTCSDVLNGAEFIGYPEAQLRASSNNIADLPYQGIEVNGTFYPYNGGVLDPTNGVVVMCEDRGINNDKHIDIKVKVTTETTTGFLHLMLPGTIKNTVEAVTRVEPRHSFAYGAALLSDKNLEDCTPSDNCGVFFVGGSDTYIVGGGIHSDSVVDAENNADVTISDGNVSSYGSIDGIATSDVTNGSITSNTNIYNDDIVVGTPNCPANPPGFDPTIKVGNGETQTIPPGNYTEITNSGGSLTLQPGLYCISGNKGVSITGGITEGVGVTFYLIDSPFTSTATSPDGTEYVSLEAPPVDYVNPLGGWLIICEPTNTKDIEITGGGNSYYAGAIFHPDGLVKIAGSSDVMSQSFGTQIIAKTISVRGNARVDINFNSANVPQVPAMINLMK